MSAGGARDASPLDRLDHALATDPEWTREHRRLLLAALAWPPSAAQTWRLWNIGRHPLVLAALSSDERLRHALARRATSRDTHAEESALRDLALSLLRRTEPELLVATPRLIPRLTALADDGRSATVQGTAILLLGEIGEPHLPAIPAPIVTAATRPPAPPRRRPTQADLDAEAVRPIALSALVHWPSAAPTVVPRLLPLATATPQGDTDRTPERSLEALVALARALPEGALAAAVRAALRPWLDGPNNVSDLWLAMADLPLWWRPAALAEPATRASVERALTLSLPVARSAIRQAPAPFALAVALRLLDPGYAPLALVATIEAVRTRSDLPVPRSTLLALATHADRAVRLAVAPLWARVAAQPTTSPPRR